MYFAPTGLLRIYIVSRGFTPRWYIKPFQGNHQGQVVALVCLNKLMILYLCQLLIKRHDQAYVKPFIKSAGISLLLYFRNL